jgi:hypothetical protein
LRTSCVQSASYILPTGNNTENRGGRLCGIVHNNAMRPAAQSGYTLLRYVRHRTDPICFFNYILIKAFFDYV